VTARDIPLQGEELVICALADQLDGVRHVAVGSASPLPAAAAWLVHLKSGGRTRISMLGGREVFFTEGGREMFDCAATGRIDAFFLSGGQIDGQGNINLMGTGRYPDLDVRWGGTYGAPYLYSLAKRVVLFRDEHTRRVMVPKVDFVTAAGSNAPNVHRPGGPWALVTPRCVFRYDRARQGFQLASVHPGHTVEEVRDHTAFEFALPEGAVPVTPLPDAGTLEVLRGAVPAHIRLTYPQFTERLFGAGEAR
jgi:glutaconate CoA-transferase subunit B